MNQEINVPIEEVVEFNYPSLLTRVKAMFVDVSLIIGFWLLMGVAIKYAGGVSDWVRVMLLLVPLYIYEPFMVAFKGGTIGHKLMRIEVKNVNDPSKNINVFYAIFRFIVKGLLGWLSFLTVSFNNRNRALHNMASGAIIVYNPK